MISDITLGQFYPVSSFVHKLDAQIKIILTLLFMISVFFIKGFVGFLIILIFLILTVKCSNIPFKFLIKGIKPILFFVIFTVILNLFMEKNKALFS